MGKRSKKEPLLDTRELKRLLQRGNSTKIRARTAPKPRKRRRKPLSATAGAVRPGRPKSPYKMRPSTSVPRLGGPATLTTESMPALPTTSKLATKPTFLGLTPPPLETIDASQQLRARISQLSRQRTALITEAKTLRDARAMYEMERVGLLGRIRSLEAAAAGGAGTAAAKAAAAAGSGSAAGAEGDDDAELDPAAAAEAAAAEAAVREEELSAALAVCTEESLQWKDRFLHSQTQLEQRASKLSAARADAARLQARNKALIATLKAVTVGGAMTTPAPGMTKKSLAAAWTQLRDVVERMERVEGQREAIMSRTAEVDALRSQLARLRSSLRQSTAASSAASDSRSTALSQLKVTHDEMAELRKALHSSRAALQRTTVQNAKLRRALARAAPADVQEALASLRSERKLAASAVKREKLRREAVEAELKVAREKPVHRVSRDERLNKVLWSPEMHLSPPSAPASAARLSSASDATDASSDAGGSVTAGAAAGGGASDSLASAARSRTSGGSASSAAGSGSGSGSGGGGGGGGGGGSTSRSTRRRSSVADGGMPLSPSSTHLDGRDDGRSGATPRHSGKHDSESVLSGSSGGGGGGPGSSSGGSRLGYSSTTRKTLLKPLYPIGEGDRHGEWSKGSMLKQWLADETDLKRWHSLESFKVLLGEMKGNMKAVFELALNMRNALAATQHASYALDRREAIALVVREMSSLVKAERCLFFWRRPSDNMLLSWTPLEYKVPMGRGGILSRVVERGKPVIISETSLAATYFDPDVDSLPGLDIRSLLAVPAIAADGYVVGVLFVTNKKVGSFNIMDQILMSTLAVQAATMLTHADRHLQLLTQRRRSAAVLRTMPGLCIDMINVDVHAFSRRVEVACKHSMGVRRAVVYLGGSAMPDDRLVFPAAALRSSVFRHYSSDSAGAMAALVSSDASGSTASSAAAGKLRSVRLHAGAGIAGRVICTNEAMTVLDPYESTYYNGNIDVNSREALYVHPLRNSGGRVLGCVEVSLPDVNEALLTDLLSFCEQAGNMLDVVIQLTIAREHFGREGPVAMERARVQAELRATQEQLRRAETDAGIARQRLAWEEARGEDMHDIIDRLDFPVAGETVEQRVARAKKDLAKAERRAAARPRPRWAPMTKEEKAAVKLQSSFRGHRVRHILPRREGAARRIQSSFRGHRVRRDLAKRHHAATRIQKHVRGRSVRQAARRARRSAIDLQRVYRGHAERKRLEEKHAAATVLQKHVRGRQTRAYMAWYTSAPAPMEVAADGSMHAVVHDPAAITEGHAGYYAEDGSYVEASYGAEYGEGGHYAYPDDSAGYYAEDGSFVATHADGTYAHTPAAAAVEEVSE